MASSLHVVPHEDAIVLDNAAWHALTGPHASFAIGDDIARRYPEDVAPFVAVRSWDDPRVWDALTHIVAPGAEIGISGADPVFPPGWEIIGQGEGVQLVETDALCTRPDEEAIVLGADDVPEMLAIVERNQPGPFRPRTYELGRYIGIRREGRLVAMAGERLHPEGWTEISAVATDADYRRQGLASRLVLDVAHHIRARGDRALLHAAATNTGAIAAYERLGFALRRRSTFSAVRTPA
ncbi:GNAT family N-acetyltransferase [Microbacterium rhizomatis]|uniref:GNAT family N-acetyltransferase n=1 Tax=Microbacterium rhizomatis TaxID=1631477 RepID=A0A5J5J8F0_9MICO|nr:GNAT family N-acetyltransferase [Microbacterium rhizomatis]KAA9111444.1 GNAT family N-acetyltransferase [Microbacterium rhizomatis]